MATPTTTAAPASVPARRFTIRAHGNADLQARLEAAAPLLEALLLGKVTVPPAPAPSPAQADGDDA